MIDKRAITLIKKHEGFSAKAYKCPAGILTIGYGTTQYSNGKKVKENGTITQEQAEKEVCDFCEKFYSKTISVVEKKRQEQLNQNQICALCSLIYNIGEEQFLSSKCFQYLCNKNDKKALENWNWISAKGKTLPGLIKRRNEEIELFFNIKNFIK